MKVASKEWQTIIEYITYSVKKNKQIFYKNYTSISIYSTLVDVTKWAGRAGFRLGQSGRGSKQVTG